MEAFLRKVAGLLAKISDYMKAVLYYAEVGLYYAKMAVLYLASIAAPAIKKAAKQVFAFVKKAAKKTAVYIKKAVSNIKQAIANARQKSLQRKEAAAQKKAAAAQKEEDAFEESIPAPKKAKPAHKKKASASVQKRNKQPNPFVVFLKKTGYLISLVAKGLYLLRGLLLAIPVFVCAISLAQWNLQRLPEIVGINLLANGEFQWMIARNVAVMAPIAVTGVCLLLMLCSKKVLFPFMISVFSLVLPLLIWAINTFPY